MAIAQKIFHNRHFIPAVATLIYLATRFLLIWVFQITGDSLNDDGLSEYWTTTDRYLDEGIEAFGSDPYVEPGYPILIWLGRHFISNSLTGVFIIQTVVSAVGCFYFCLLTRHLSGKKSVEIIAAALYIFSPYALRIAVKVSEVPLFRMLLVAAVYHFIKGFHHSKHAIISGIFFGVCILVRTMIIPGVLTLYFFLLWSKKIKKASLFMFFCLLVCSPMFYVYKTKSDVFLPTRGGLNFFLANNEFYGRIYPIYHVDSLESYANDLFAKEMPGKMNDAKAKDRFFYQKGWEFINEYPDRFIKNKVRNLLLFFDAWKVPRMPLGRFSVEVGSGDALTFRRLSNARTIASSALAECSHALYRFTVLFFGCIGIWMRREFWMGKDFVLISLWLSFLAVYSVFWPSTRLYSPVMFVFMFYAGYAIAELLARRKRKAQALTLRNSPG